MRFRRLRKSESGAALVEFAVVVPLLLFVVWAIIDFARAFYTVNSLASAVREGARVAAVQQNPSAAASRDTVRARVKQAFNAFGGDSIKDAQIVITDESGCTMPCNKRVTVEVRNYEWLASTPINIFAGGKVTMTRRATFRWEREDT